MSKLRPGRVAGAAGKLRGGKVDWHLDGAVTS